LQNNLAPRIGSLYTLCCGVGLLALFGLGFIGFLISNNVYRDVEGNSSLQLTTQSNPSNTALSEPSLAPTPIAGTDSVTVRQAMTNCDEEAGRNPNGLYFLVTPVISASFDSATRLIPPGEDYQTFLLIPSRGLISGLEDSSLQPSARKYEFSVLNGDTAQIQKWSAANSASKFAQMHPFGFSKFQIGISFEDKSVIWTNQYARQKGICYWVNALFHTPPYSPPSGRVDFARSNRFPVWARTLRCANSVCDPEQQLLPQQWGTN
jgi:hypothetical protein